MMSSRSWSTILVGAACGGALVVAVLFAASQDNGDAPVEGKQFNSLGEVFEDVKQNQGGEAAEDWRRQHFSNSAPELVEQRRREIEELRNMNIDAVIDSFYRGNIDYERHGHQINAQSELEYSGFNYTRICLADYRFSRLYDLLSKLPPDEARGACQRLFDETREPSWAAFAAILGEKSERIDAAKTHDFGTLDYATRCIVLASALFCDPETVLSQLDSWRIRSLPQQAKFLLVAENAAEKLPNLRKYFMPDNQFTVHIMMILLDRQGRLTPDVLAEAHRLGLPETIKVQLTSWATPADAGYIDPQSAAPFVEKELTVTLNWRAGQHNYPEETTRVAGYLRGLLQPGTTVDLDPQPTPAEAPN